LVGEVHLDHDPIELTNPRHPSIVSIVSNVPDADLQSGLTAALIHIEQPALRRAGEFWPSAERDKRAQAAARCERPP
jgi:hypothetical protein